MTGRTGKQAVDTVIITQQRQRGLGDIHWQVRRKSGISGMGGSGG